MNDDRRYWIGVAERLATPVLEHLAARRLKVTMPVEAAPGAVHREQFSHLEALGRLLMGLAPWLELGGGTDAEGLQRAHFAELARMSIDAATDPASPDRMNFSTGQQPLVDAAFLALALLRAPRELWEKLEPRVRDNLVAALRETHKFQPARSNWVLFASTIEAAFRRFGVDHDAPRLASGLHDHEQWYVGDGTYGDGPKLHWDYYNSFVIQPMLLACLGVVGGDGEWKKFATEQTRRATRYAAVQERMVAPDGSYPVTGRSITYRAGAFQTLAAVALSRTLPKELPPAQVRGALTAVQRRTLEAPGTFDEHGWLQIGLAGHQPNLGEPYISTGSLYLCSGALLPLGLPADDPFWIGEPLPWTSQKAWGGTDLPADHSVN